MYFHLDQFNIFIRRDIVKIDQFSIKKSYLILCTLTAYLVSLYFCTIIQHDRQQQCMALKVRIFAPALFPCHFVILMTGPNYSFGNMQTVLRDHHSKQSCKDVIVIRYAIELRNSGFLFKTVRITLLETRKLFSGISI